MAKTTKKMKTVTDLVPVKQQVHAGVTIDLSDKEARAMDVRRIEFE